MAVMLVELTKEVDKTYFIYVLGTSLANVAECGNQRNL